MAALALEVINWLTPDVANLPRVAIGLFVSLVLPGYLLVAIVFPAAKTLRVIERWGLVLSLNAAIVLLIPFFLTLAHVRLDVASVTTATCGLVALLAIGLTWRRGYIPAEELYSFEIPRGRAPWLVAALALLLALGIWRVASINLTAAYPDFAVLGAGGRLHGYPSQVSIGSAYPLTLAVNNPTSQRTTYRLVVADSIHARLREQRVSVAPHGQWSQRILLPADRPARREVVRFMLFQGKKVVRELWIRYRIV